MTHHRLPLRRLRARAAGRALAALALLRSRRRPETRAEERSCSSHASPWLSGRPGVAFGYWILLPRAVHFLTNYDTQHFHIAIRRAPYYNFVVTVLVGVVLIFQTPLVVLGLVVARRPQLAHAAQAPADRLLRHRRGRARAARAGSGDDVPRAPADVAAVRGVDLARGALRAAPGKGCSGLGYPGRLMARAAVRAKQQEAAKAQPSKARAHGRRRHSGGGNPNQELFFVRLRRHQKWVYALLAVVFGLSFVLVGRRLRQRRRPESALEQHLRRRRRHLDLEGSRTRSRRIPRRDTATSPPRTSRRTATPPRRSSALQSISAIKKNDAATWAELGGLELTAGKPATRRSTRTRSRRAQPPTRARPSCPAARSGSAVGQNPTYEQASQQASSRAVQALPAGDDRATPPPSPTTRRPSKLHPRSTTYLQELAERGA